VDVEQLRRGVADLLGGLALGLLPLLGAEPVQRRRGLVGPGAATEFSAFRDWADDLPDARAMLEGRAPIQIPQRADQRYALCAALVHILWNDRREPGADHLLDGFFRICEQLPSDFAAMAMIDALTGPTEEASRIRSARIFDHPGFIRWTTQHGQAFADLQAA
jgi:hypothetical protein